MWAVLEVYSSIIAAALRSGTGQNGCSLLTGGQKDGLQEKQIEEECKISPFFRITILSNRRALPV